MSLDRIVSAVESALKRTQRGLIVGCVLAALLAAAFGFATAALYLALAAQMQPLYACLVIAGGFLVLALLVLLVARAGNAPDTRRPPRERPDPERPGLEPDAVSHLIATFLAGVRAGREGFGRRRR